MAQPRSAIYLLDRGGEGAEPATSRTKSNAWGSKLRPPSCESPRVTAEPQQAAVGADDEAGTPVARRSVEIDRGLFDRIGVSSAVKSPTSTLSEEAPCSSRQPNSQRV